METIEQQLIAAAKQIRLATNNETDVTASFHISDREDGSFATMFFFGVGSYSVSNKWPYRSFCESTLSAALYKALKHVETCHDAKALKLQQAETLANELGLFLVPKYVQAEGVVS